MKKDWVSVFSQLGSPDVHWIPLRRARITQPFERDVAWKFSQQTSLPGPFTAACAYQSEKYSQKSRVSNHICSHCKVFSTSHKGNVSHRYHHSPISSNSTLPLANYYRFLILTDTHPPTTLPTKKIFSSNSRNLYPFSCTYSHRQEKNPKLKKNNSHFQKEKKGVHRI